MQEFNMVQGLRNALGITCPDCGELNTPGVEQCENCSASLIQEEGYEDYDEEESLSFVAEEGLESAPSGRKGLKKVPLEKAKNLILLRETVEDAQNGEITLDQYRMNVTKVFNIAKTGAEVFQTDIVQKRLATLPKIQQELANNSALLFEEYMEGCQRMLEYRGGEDLTPALEGLQIVERVLTDMDAIQDQAIEIAKEELAQQEERNK